MKDWILLDRDGTIIKEKNYLHDPAEAELLPGAAKGLRLLAEQGFHFAVTTNQSGIGRGYFTREAADKVNNKIDRLLAAEGVHIEGWFCCPHSPEEKCRCRKPEPGLAQMAAAALGFEINDIAWVIGDKKADLDFAAALDSPSVLVMTGYGAKSCEEGARGTITCCDLSAAAEEIIKRTDTEMKSSDIFDKDILSHQKAASRLPEIKTDLEKCADKIISSLKQGGRLLLCGNGGSAADAQHIAAELSGRFLKERPALDALALSCNTSAVTAIANDYSFAEIFARQLEAHGREGDVLLAITTSGTSENILRALRKAREMKITALLLTGKDGGPAAKEAELSIIVPSEETPRIQELHILTGHILCNIIENAFFD